MKESWNKKTVEYKRLIRKLRILKGSEKNEKISDQKVNCNKQK